MRPFVVSPAHIDAILSVAINGPAIGLYSHHREWRPPIVWNLLRAREALNHSTADRAGAELLRECIVSVAHSHPTLPTSELPGPAPTPVPSQYEWTNLGKCLTPIECCKAIDCFEDQSREHPDWYRSAARSFCDRLRQQLISWMDGYEEAPWEWSVDQVVERANERRLQLLRPL
jgi:hypothetical protein